MIYLIKMDILRILFILFPLVSKAGAAVKPHILFIVADDLGKLYFNHICLMDFPIFINWTSPFFRGVWRTFFHFYHTFCGVWSGSALFA